MPALDTTAVENEQKALMLLAEEVQKAPDQETRDALIAAIQESAAKLQKLCDELQAQADAMAPKPDSADGEEVNPVVEIVLTRDQFARVKEETGVEVPSVRIPDPDGTITKNMAFIEPDFVYECALNQARAFKEMLAEAEENAKTEEEFLETLKSAGIDPNNPTGNNP